MASNFIVHGEVAMIWVELVAMIMVGYPPNYYVYATGCRENSATPNAANEDAAVHPSGCAAPGWALLRGVAA
jgi:hypothetical protein